MANEDVLAVDFYGLRYHGHGDIMVSRYEPRDPNANHRGLYCRLVQVAPPCFA